eukprot:TRINITY_DN3703_c0_g3_i1.p1 TRINITY_DN3703_c0_g3~~TRINITY_DN3703_c0_g3_i1.p1  ORF type:complete len:645 (+),score=146.93 TRINITY_DN3703_c0_g3_i1:419-2353(+)
MDDEEACRKAPGEGMRQCFEGKGGGGGGGGAGVGSGGASKGGGAKKSVSPVVKPKTNPAAVVSAGGTAITTSAGPVADSGRVPEATSVPAITVAVAEAPSLVDSEALPDASPLAKTEPDASPPPQASDAAPLDSLPEPVPQSAVPSDKRISPSSPTAPKREPAEPFSKPSQNEEAPSPPNSRDVPVGNASKGSVKASPKVSPKPSPKASPKSSRASLKGSPDEAALKRPRSDQVPVAAETASKASLKSSSKVLAKVSPESFSKISRGGPEDDINSKPSIRPSRTFLSEGVEPEDALAGPTSLGASDELLPSIEPLPAPALKDAHEAERSSDPVGEPEGTTSIASLGFDLNQLPASNSDASDESQAPAAGQKRRRSLDEASDPSQHPEPSQKEGLDRQENVSHDEAPGRKLRDEVGQEQDVKMNDVADDVTDNADEVQIPGGKRKFYEEEGVGLEQSGIFGPESKQPPSGHHLNVQLHGKTSNDKGEEDEDGGCLSPTATIGAFRFPIVGLQGTEGDLAWEASQPTPSLRAPRSTSATAPTNMMEGEEPEAERSVQSNLLERDDDQVAKLMTKKELQKTFAGEPNPLYTNEKKRKHEGAKKAIPGSVQGMKPAEAFAGKPAVLSVHEEKGAGSSAGKGKKQLKGI